jgi:isopentenyl diphosphate isomerase/L-lactate dehydrogenase-like FMN-dependent dehydrogenase
MIGRPFLYGLAGMGGAGVARALEIFRGEIDLALALTGRASLADLDRSAIAWA